MKKALQIILLVISVILANIGFFTAIFGSGTAAASIVEIVVAVILLSVSAFFVRPPRTFGNIWRVTCVVLALIFVLCGVFSIYAGFSFYYVAVEDFDRRVEIWGDSVDGNSSANKLEDMNINYNARVLGATAKFSAAIVGSEYVDRENSIDSFTYIYGIKGGYEKETYEDIPYIIPYTVQNASGAVLIVCGGNFGYKSMESGTNESKDIALALNEKGISAFVLWYRSNPYQFPVPQLDLQRAVRYLRCHAEEYGFDSDNLGLLGFGAGGYLVGSFINQYMGTDAFSQSYIKDEVDSFDDSVSVAAMIYPMMSFNDNVSMLFAVADADIVRDETKRKELLVKTDLIENFSSSDVKQLVCYGTDDDIVGSDGAKAYVAKAKENNADITEIAAEKQGQGLSTEYYLDTFAGMLCNS